MESKFNIKRLEIMDMWLWRRIGEARNTLLFAMLLGFLSTQLSPPFSPSLHNNPLFRPFYSFSHSPNPWNYLLVFGPLLSLIVLTFQYKLTLPFKMSKSSNLFLFLVSIRGSSPNTFSITIFPLS